MTQQHVQERAWQTGDRVLVTSVEEAGAVTVSFGDGRYYVRLDSGDTIAVGREVLADG